MPDDADTDAFYRARLFRDYDRLIKEFTEARGRCGKEMVMFFTYEELQLIGAALRSAREQAATNRVNASDIDPTAGANPNFRWDGDG